MPLVGTQDPGIASWASWVPAWGVKRKQKKEGSKQPIMKLVQEEWKFDIALQGEESEYTLISSALVLDPDAFPEPGSEVKDSGAEVANVAEGAGSWHMLSYHDNGLLGDDMQDKMPRATPKKPKLTDEQKRLQ